VAPVRVAWLPSERRGAHTARLSIWSCPLMARSPLERVQARLRYTEPDDRISRCAAISSSALITCITALISARWVNACGKLPR
jgi:hypothetical protein